MAITILSEVTPKELTLLKLNRIHKPIEAQHYGIVLRAVRMSQGKYIDDLRELLKEKGINKTRATVARWERNCSSPSVNVISIWAECLNLKMSVFIDAHDRSLVKGHWIEQLKTLRRDRALSREKINREIGVSPWMITLFEKGIKSPTEPELKAWANSLGATACLVFE